MICLVRGMEYQEKDGRFFHFGGGGGYDEASETDGEASRRMQQMATVERELFSRVITQTHGNQAKAARCRLRSHGIRCAKNWPATD